MKEMMPIGPLMIEHRLIERVVAAMRNEIGKISSEMDADCTTISHYVDFILVYADKCHHGKEEEILFRELKKQQIEPEHERIMNELLDDHRKGREFTAGLDEANRRYAEGDKKYLTAIKDRLQDLVALYPQHIEKEDRHFFLPVMKYFSKEQQDSMLDEENEFDRKIIHEHYRELTERLETRFK